MHIQNLENSVNLMIQFATQHSQVLPTIFMSKTTQPDWLENPIIFHSRDGGEKRYKIVDFKSTTDSILFFFYYFFFFLFFLIFFTIFIFLLLLDQFNIYLFQT